MHRHLSISGVIVLLLACLLSSQGRAQNTLYEPFEGKDALGFSVGLNYSAVKLELNPDTTLPANTALWTRNAGGVSIGLRYHKELTQKIKVGAQLNLVILSNDIIYEDDEGLVIEESLYPAVLELPLHFSFTNKSFDNNISAIFGVKLSRIISPSDENFILRDSFASADFGLGKEFVFERFTLAPEITYSFGLENLYRYSSKNEFATYISAMSANQLSLKLHFYRTRK